MIGKLSGRVDELAEDHLLLDVGGVGYLVFASAKTLVRVGPVGSAAALLIETHVREDHIHLYGFADAGERSWFRLLLTVQGVGSRVALALLSVLTPNELAQTIAAQDKVPLTRAAGVGAKLAARLLTELKDKVSGLALGPVAAAGGVLIAVAGPAEDAVAALTQLGYRRVEAFAAVAEAARSLGEGATLENLIKAGLKELAR